MKNTQVGLFPRQQTVPLCGYNFSQFIDPNEFFLFFLSMTESAIQSILLNLGMVVEFRDWLLKRYTPGYSKPSKEAATREYSSEEMQKICIVGDQLLAFACGKGWEALVKILLPVALFSVYVAKASSCAHALESGEKTKEVDSGPKPGE